MTSFRQALAALLGDLTPQPWDYTAPCGTTLTVIPACLPETPGRAEVTIRITASHTRAAEIGITTADMPGLLDALDTCGAWSHTTTSRDHLALTWGAGMELAAAEQHWDEPRTETTATIRLPAAQRQPFASALRRATDIARAWEIP